MKKLVLSGLLAVCFVMGWAQTDVSLKINHKLGTEDFALDAVGTNNLGQEFKASRLEYYLTRVTIVHDGGTETAVPDEVVALVRPEDEISTTIDLGSFDVTSIEGVKFHIGVYEPINNEDPTLHPSGHPLALQSPSMHWGWTSGYRFIAYEGYAGDGFSQNFQLHGLGNENYFEVESDVEVETVDGALVMSLNGDYAAGLNDIEVASGVVAHGTFGDAKKVLENWRDVVFGLYTVGIDETGEDFDWSVYPNPSQGDITVTIASVTAIDRVEVLNPLGERVMELSAIENQFTMTLPNSGVYFVSLLNTAGETVVTERVVIK
ncbi:MAG: T9SS type A sorting domain-containing protein [Flavobacteriales bacterium]|nr:T9SS type A sorting domain-containing protein [Flavobacteriales bacterium]